MTISFLRPMMSLLRQKYSESRLIYADKPSHFSTSSLIVLLLFATLASISWPFFVKTDEVLSVEGRLETLTEVDTVNSPQNGLIKVINVKEGDLVRKGSILFQLDSADAETRLQESKQQLLTAKEEYAQLKLTVAYAQQSLRQYQDQLRAQLDADLQVLSAYRETAAAGATSKLSIVTQEAKVLAQKAELQRQSSEAAKLLSENSSKLSAAQASISQHQAQLTLQQSALNQLQVKAPVDGFVYDIKPTGTDYPVSFGSLLASVTPLDELKAEVCLPISATGDFHRYQDVSITVQSLNLLQKGVIQGYVDYISSDVVESQDGKSQPCFKSYINLNSQSLIGADGDPIHLRPGLGITASIKLRKLTYYEMIFDSMFKKGKRS